MIIVREMKREGREIVGRERRRDKSKSPQNRNRKLQEMGDGVRADETVMLVAKRDGDRSDFDGKFRHSKNVNQCETRESSD
jgi:hypothetical protein